ncbi:MAG: RdgB/HAM1 family non-canonical purine NTP pyrophosphatase [Bacteroidales bacterium]|nr:RdgB/HAM1 family non-canonical purine NTP pyrophosphatase [Bacteroidales bacterium]
MKIVFATSNKGKLREAQEILGDGFELVTPADCGITEDIPETGETLRENSLQKALYIKEHTGLDCFADDTGLEVDALGGAPGVHTARYGAEIAERDGLPPVASHDFAANIDTLLRELSKIPGADRRARFRTSVTLILNGETHFFDGVMEGRIAESKAGCGGFGYDPVFIADEFPDRTVAEIPEETKNAISHRGKALRAMAEYLNR